MTTDEVGGCVFWCVCVCVCVCVYSHVDYRAYEVVN